MAYYYQLKPSTLILIDRYQSEKAGLSPILGESFQYALNRIRNQYPSVLRGQYVQ